MSIDLIDKINYNRPKCLYCGSMCEADSGGEALMVMTTYDCKSCGDYFTIISIGRSKELSFTCKEFCIFYDVGSDIYEMYNTDHGSNDNRMQIPKFDIDFSDREKLYEKLKTYLIFA